jgi:hypothetical protein
VKAQLGTSEQVRQSAAEIASVLGVLETVYRQTPNATNIAPFVVDDVNDLKAGMATLAAAQDGPAFDDALLGLCGTSRVAAAQKVGPWLAQSSAQRLAQQPRPDQQTVQLGNAVIAVGNIIAEIPSWCFQYAANLQGVQAADAQARQAACRPFSA